MRKYKQAGGILSLALSILLMGACVADHDSNLKSQLTEPDEATIEIGEYTATPNYLVVNKGTMVTFENDTNTTHSIHSKGAVQFDSIEALGPDEEIKVLMDEVGTYEFYCDDNNNKMVGKIKVVDDEKISSNVYKEDSDLQSSSHESVDAM